MQQSSSSNDHAPATPTLLTFRFHDDTVVTFERNGQRFVVMRRIVENIGLSWGSQSTKLNDQQAKFNCCDIETVGADGGTRSMLCMPIEKLQLWLACINPNKITKPAIRAKVELYQAESAVALHDYWTKGGAARDEPVLGRPHEDVDPTITAFGQAEGLKKVTEARHTFGVNAARQLWFVLGLPIVPAMQGYEPPEPVRPAEPRPLRHPSGVPWPKKSDLN